MNKKFSYDYIQFAAERCRKALEEFPGFLEREQNENEDQEMVRADAQLICYLQGYRDAINMMYGRL